MGRELLSAVVICHPFIVSLLTEKVCEAMEQIGAVGSIMYSLAEQCVYIKKTLKIFLGSEVQLEIYIICLVKWVL